MLFRSVGYLTHRKGLFYECVSTDLTLHLHIRIPFAQELKYGIEVSSRSKYKVSGIPFESLLMLIQYQLLF